MNICKDLGHESEISVNVSRGWFFAGDEDRMMRDLVARVHLQYPMPIPAWESHDPMIKGLKAVFSSTPFIGYSRGVLTQQLQPPEGSVVSGAIQGIQETHGGEDCGGVAHPISACFVVEVGDMFPEGDGMSSFRHFRSEQKVAGVLGRQSVCKWETLSK